MSKHCETCGSYHTHYPPEPDPPTRCCGAGDVETCLPPCARMTAELERLEATAPAIDPDLEPPSLEALLAGTEFEGALTEGDD